MSRCSSSSPNRSDGVRIFTQNFVFRLNPRWYLGVWTPVHACGVSQLWVPQRRNTVVSGRICKALEGSDPELGPAIPIHLKGPPKGGGIRGTCFLVPAPTTHQPTLGAHTTSTTITTRPKHHLPPPPQPHTTVGPLHHKPAASRSGVPFPPFNSIHLTPDSLPLRHQPVPVCVKTFSGFYAGTIPSRFKLLSIRVAAPPRPFLFFILHLI